MFKLKNGLLFLSLFASFAISVLAPPVHAQTLASAASLSGVVADPSGAVSYTHLDVYKRQCTY